MTTNVMPVTLVGENQTALFSFIEECSDLACDHNKDMLYFS